MIECNHELYEREVACADGLCPLCLRAEIETERQRLAACGVAALGYFNGCLPEYDSASLQDVLRLRAEVDQLRARLAECERDAERYRWLADQECGDVFMEHRPGDKVGLDLAIDAARAAQEDAK